MITRAKLSSVVQGLPKYRSMLAGNTAYSPATFNSIATFTASGGETSCTLSSIPSTYTHLQLRIRYKDTYASANTNAGVNLTFNGDTSSSYSWHGMYANGSAVTASAQDNANSISVARVGWTNSTGNPWGGVGIIDILNYTSGSTYKILRCFAGGDGNTSSTASGLAIQSGGWTSGATISSITLVPSWTAFATGTQIALYGIGS